MYLCVYGINHRQIISIGNWANYSFILHEEHYQAWSNFYGRFAQAQWYSALPFMMESSRFEYFAIDRYHVERREFPVQLSSEKAVVKAASRLRPPAGKYLVSALPKALMDALLTNMEALYLFYISSKYTECPNLSLCGLHKGACIMLDCQFRVQLQRFRIDFVCSI